MNEFEGFDFPSEDFYFNWLCSQIETEDRNRSNYKKLLFTLYSIEFTWTVPMDENRASDGLDLRNEFTWETSIDAHFFMPSFCTVLEMMVALSRRGMRSIFYDDDDAPRPCDMFWLMVQNMRLDVLTDWDFDETRADFIIERMLKRQYGRDGRGGLFFTLRDEFDMRTIEIWYQMSIFMEEFYGI